MVSISFIGKHSSHVVMRVEQQFENDICLLYRKRCFFACCYESLATAEAWSLFVLFKIMLFLLLCKLQYRWSMCPVVNMLSLFLREMNNNVMLQHLL